MHLPAEIYSVDAVRRIDRRAIDDAGIDGYALMNRAAGAALAAARAAFPEARRWQVVCGGGNNAGDGYVLARLAAAEGIDADVAALVPPDRLRGDAATAHRDFVAAGGTVRAWGGGLDADAASSSMPFSAAGSNATSRAHSPRPSRRSTRIRRR